MYPQSDHEIEYPSEARSLFLTPCPFQVELQSMNRKMIIDGYTYNMIYHERDALDSQVVLVTKGVLSAAQANK